MRHIKIKGVFLTVVVFFLVMNIPVAGSESVKRINVLYNAYSTIFPVHLRWSWDYFKEDATTTDNNELAIAALLLSGNAEKRYATGCKKALMALGFSSSSLYAVNYDKDKISRPGIVFGLKKNAVGSKHVLCMVVRGSTTNADWVTDAKAQLIDGFRDAGEETYSQLKDYMHQHKLNKSNTILFVTGHSYGAACASQAVQLANADRMTDPSKTFVYLFATPNNYIYRDSANRMFNYVRNYVNVDDTVPYTVFRTDSGKIGRIIYFDYGKELNRDAARSRQALFELGYQLIRGRYFYKDKSVGRDHETYTYMSFVLSSERTEEIFAMFGIHQGSGRITGENKTAIISYSLPRYASGGEVYMSTSKDGDYRFVKTISDKSYKAQVTGLKNNKKYYFRLRAYYKPVSAIAGWAISPALVLKTMRHKKIYTDFSDPISVTVKKAVKVSLNTTFVTMYYPGEKYTIKATVKGTKQGVKWKCSKRGVIVVSKNGTLTPLKKGKVTVTASVAGKKARCYVTVKERINLTKYKDKKISTVRKELPGGKYDGSNYRYREACFDAGPDDTVYNIEIASGGRGFSVAGVYVGMEKKPTLKWLQSVGWKYAWDTAASDDLVIMYNRKMGYLMINMKNDKVNSITFGNLD